MFRSLLQNSKGRAFLVAVMLIVLAVVWQPVLNNDFLTNWDDQWMVTGNPHLFEVTHLNTISTDAVTTIFAEPVNGQYSPLNTLIYLVIVRAGGMEPFGFQLFFLIVHILNFMMVGLVLQKLLAMITGLNLDDYYRFLIAWATAFLFAIHPMQVEAVAWISASKIPLYSFFYLLGLWVYLVYRQKGKWWQLGVVLLCFFASLLSKEQAVVFVASLITVDLVVCKNLKQKGIWLEKVPFVLIALFFGLFTLSIQGSSGVGGSYPLGQRLLFANYSFWEYIIKLMVPHNLSYFYFFPMDPGEAIPLRFWFYPLATGVFCWVLVEYRHKINGVILFGGLFFLINIALVLHLLPTPRAAIIADRYVYLSAIGFFLVVIYGMVQFIGWLSTNQTMIRSGLAIAGLVYLLMAGYTHQRTQDWKDFETLYNDVESVLERHLGIGASGAGFINRHMLSAYRDEYLKINTVQNGIP
jgi:hypothetical protein